MAKWLFKEEPTHYSYDELTKDGRTTWTGVKNPLAQKHLKTIRKDDQILYYHTGKEKAVVGLARAATDAFPDPGDPSGKAYVVDIIPVSRLGRAVPLSEIKANRTLAGLPLVRLPRLSVMPVSDAEWDEIQRLSRS